MLNAFNKLFTPKTTKIALKKGIRGRLELVSLEERVVPAAFTVVNNSDSGVGSLRQAILDANATTANDIINFSVVNSPYSINLASALPSIATTNSAGTLTINGLGASSLTTINANGGNFSIFTIISGGNLTISGVTVTGAQHSSGGVGAFFNNGTLTVTNSTISGNISLGGTGFYNAPGSTLNVSNSTISGNTATQGSGGGIFNLGTLSISNSTISGNTASFSGGGGGIRNGASGTSTVTNCTISGNSAITGGGIFNDSGTLNIANTIIANSLAPGQITPTDYAGSGTIGTNTNNLVEDGSITNPSSTPTGSGNISGDPVLSPLANNGGPTFTMALGATSPAIAAGNATVSNAAPIFGLDQRYYTRSSTPPSIGAFEFNGSIPPAPTVTQNLSNLAINATTLIITGTGFSTIAANNTVSLTLGAFGTVTSATATQLTVTFNTAPTPGELKAVVTTNSISSGDEVEVATIVEVPTITSISPGAGPIAGGTTITINGLALSNVTAVTIGGIAASSFTVVSGQKITAITPPGTRGAANVFVTDNNGTNSTTVNTVFNYTAGAFITPAVPFSPAFPHALSINAPGSAVTNSASFTVTFNQPVTGVDAADFNLVATGTVANGTISSVTGSGAT